MPPSSFIYNFSKRNNLILFFCFLVFFSLFIFLHFYLGHLTSLHFIFSVSLTLLFFASKKTRVFFLVAFPIAFKEMIFDFLRYVPFHFLKPIHVAGPYLLEKKIFGVWASGSLKTLDEYFLEHNHVVLDLLTGMIYHLHAPVMLLSVLVFWKLKNKEFASRYALAYFLMNLLAFATYLIYPAAPPWYVQLYGLDQPLASVTGYAAGLLRFDALLGIHYSEKFYALAPVVFGAIPSMHVGFAALEFFYSLKTQSKIRFFYFLFLTIMCFSALYLQHHYLIDVLCGLIYAVFAFFVIEKTLIKKISQGHQFLFYERNTSKN